MNVSAIIVTRGDIPRGDLLPLFGDWPEGVFSELLMWENTGALWRYGNNGYFIRSGAEQIAEVSDLGAAGRYAAIAHAECDLIYVQDDDCIVARSDIQRLLEAHVPGTLVSLMPRSRTDYEDTVLVGWGSLFLRHLPEKAFARWRAAGEETESEDFRVVGADFVFPMLTPWIRLDAEHEDLPHAHAENRTWRRPDYLAVKAEYLRKARALRDA